VPVAVVIDMRGITYKQLPGVTYEQELDLLAQIYALALDSYRKQKAAEPAPEPDGCNDVRKDQDAHTAKSIIPE
jgi:hypothetical protein